MALYLQAGALVVIVLLALFSFRSDPLKLGVKTITAVTLLVVISLALQFYAIMVPFFGFPSLRLGFDALPLMISGILFGPSWAVIAGFIQDFLGLLITPTDFPFLGFTLNKIAMGIIPALIFKYMKRIGPRQMQTLVTAVLSLFMGVASWYLFATSTLVMGETVIILKFIPKLIIFSVMVLLGGFVILFVSNLFAKYHSSTISIPHWAFAVIMTQVVVSLVLTPLWLYGMYHIPVMLSFLVRVITTSIIIPIYIFVGYFVLNQLSKLQIKNDKSDV